MLTISIITLFPDLFVSPLQQSIVSRAIKNKQTEVEYIQLRDFATDSYKSVDDHPYGGGQGMILMVDVVDRAIQYCKQQHPDLSSYTVLLDPQGIRYTQQTAVSLSKHNHIILICGHYEGIDERIRTLVDAELSIGDYILTGGETAALVIIDSVVRLLPGVLASTKSSQDESFTSDMLEYPQYTRPKMYNGSTVPSILLSGNHAHIAAWQKDEALKRTKIRRPDLLKGKMGPDAARSG